jgi:hypothetical protein
MGVGNRVTATAQMRCQERRNNLAAFNHANRGRSKPEARRFPRGFLFSARKTADSFPWAVSCFISIDIFEKWIFLRTIAPQL